MENNAYQDARKENAAPSAGIYIHIPFCKQACVYCNFHFSTSLKYKDEMVQAIIAELVMQKDYLRNVPIETIYFGGGTPSLLSEYEINTIIETVQKNYTVNKLVECTLEANPDDLSREYLRGLKSTPINRLSIGVQSFREEDLLYMKRAHNAQEADYAIKAAQDHELSNISIDLIYGTPGLTDKDWKANLAKLKELAIPHFSAYALTVEEKTELNHLIQKKRSAPVDAEQAAGQFELLMEYAEVMGYEHYEISNLALPGKYAVHNTNYWRGLPYLGIGPSAHSFSGSARKWNVANNALYTKSILIDKKVPFKEEVLTEVQFMNEYIMTSLRTMWGCDLEKIEKDWGSDVLKELMKKAERLIDKGMLELKEKKLIITNKGKLFTDRIAGDLFF
ncbi:coproporphyrinogen III oxidase [Flavipsychrobacter stenotrophus]|uniref:Heme chaperone HemW n=1 Tax=Flavipsychrobacter stenotrophus TaxID=2077091 RepID=A0A2S7SV67_9BACT|nr:radical SAM family heme chaperone HemW [Flavipsychrobacter stenotrophus]PQJ10832.1 coproporphyrinogen III oxidase [Flavipsychrobacter stenotrophus]